MARRRKSEQHVYFPWERRGGLLRRIRLDQAGPVLVAALIGLVLLAVQMSERKAAGVRRTRATLLEVRAVVDSYMADHDGGCPEGLERLQATGRLETAPVDAWGRSLRLSCPGADRARYDLSSDGPDGRPGGLDRIE